MTTTAQQSKKPWYKKLWIWAVVAAVIVVGGIVNMVNGSDDPSTADTPAAIKQAATFPLPDVVGQDAATAKQALDQLGLTVKLDGGDQSVFSPANWNVDAQDPASGATATEGDTITLTVSKPEPEPTQAPVLDETTAAQFLAHAWEAKFPYGGSVHWIVDRITTVNDDGTYTFKIGATIKNQYGTKVEATIEGDVGGTTDSPQIIDSILYTGSGEIINYWG